MQQYLIGFAGLTVTFFFLGWLMTRPRSGKPLSKTDFVYSLGFALAIAAAATVLYAVYFTWLPYMVIALLSWLV